MFFCTKMTNYSVCRLCLAENVLFKAVKKGDSLLDTIYNLTSVEPLPASIETIVLCEECHHSVTQYGQFREACLRNDSMYREQLEYGSTVETICIEDNYIDGEKVLLIEGHNTEKRPPLRKKQIDEEKNPLLEDGVKKGTPQVRQTRSRSKAQADTTPVGKKASTGKKANGAAKPQRTRTCNLETSNRYLPCVRCGKMIRRSNMRKHMDTHESPKPPQLFCTYCGKRYRSAGLLKVHINSHHTFEHKYECDQCDKVYFQQNSLREHIYAKHSDEKRYECEVCGQKFSNHSKKRYHYIMSHTVAKPYSCQYCDKAFKLRSDCTLHVRTHTGEKPFACDICGKRFNKSYNVVIHKKSHRNDKAELVVCKEETIDESQS